MTDTKAVEELSETLIFEVVRALNLPQSPFVKRCVRFVFGRVARKTATAALDLDNAVAEGGVHGGALWLLPRFVKSHEARGVENIPATGPLVIASNHPASIDSVAISAYIKRRDCKIIIGDIAFFENLPHAHEAAIFAPDGNNLTGRMQVVRESIRHLKNGGALLIFPYGGIEPDPDFMPNPDEDFHLWSRSLEIFLKRVPELEILVTIASGVISKSSFHHPITWLRRERADKQRLAFMYQLARQIVSGKELYGLVPKITFGEIIKGDNHDDVLAEVEGAARRTLDKHMSWIHS
jgi:hypothetical protein